MTDALALVPDPLTIPRTPALPAARAGDFMRLADDVRLALELVDRAADYIEQREGTSHPLVVKMRMQAYRLRATP